MFEFGSIVSEALDGRARQEAREISRAAWMPAMEARASIRLRATDEEALIGETVAAYHDYPSDDLFFALVARGTC